MRVKFAQAHTPVVWNSAPHTCSKCLWMRGPSPGQWAMLTSLFGGQLFAVARPHFHLSWQENMNINVSLFAETAFNVTITMQHTCYLTQCRLHSLPLFSLRPMPS